MTEKIKKYDYILSIGRFCHTTGLLNSNGLKFFDGPWDWSGTGDETGVYDRIKRLTTGFKHWFDRKDFVPLEPEYKDKLFLGTVPSSPRPQSKAIPVSPVSNQSNIKSRQPIRIYNKRTQTYYGHDFYNSPSFDEQFPEIAERYNRRAYRTQRFIEQSDSILLVYMSHLADQRRDLPLNADIIIKLMKKLRKKYPEKIIDLYMFDHSNAPCYKNGFYIRQVLDIGIIRYISNHDEFWPSTDTDPAHAANNFMMPISICHILSRVGLTDKWKMP